MTNSGVCVPTVMCSGLYGHSVCFAREIEGNRKIQERILEQRKHPCSTATVLQCVHYIYIIENILGAQFLVQRVINISNLLSCWDVVFRIIKHHGESLEWASHLAMTSYNINNNGTYHIREEQTEATLTMCSKLRLSVNIFVVQMTWKTIILFY